MLRKVFFSKSEFISHLLCMKYCGVLQSGSLLNLQTISCLKMPCVLKFLVIILLLFVMWV